MSVKVLSERRESFPQPAALLSSPAQAKGVKPPVPTFHGAATPSKKGLIFDQSGSPHVTALAQRKIYRQLVGDQAALGALVKSPHVTLDKENLPPLLARTASKPHAGVTRTVSSAVRRSLTAQFAAIDISKSTTNVPAAAPQYQGVLFADINSLITPVLSTAHVQPQHSPAPAPGAVFHYTTAKVNKAGVRIFYTPKTDSLLGAGAFGRVVEGDEVVQAIGGQTTKTSVAMKLCFNPAYAQREIEVFKTHIQGVIHAIQLRHAYQEPTNPDRWVLVFPLLGQNIYNRYLNGHHLDLSMTEFATIGRGSFETLCALKERRLMHTDLKPDNLALHKGQFHVLDWGLARSVESFPKKCQNTRYRAPEVYLGANYDESIDTWSIGMILYELFTGQKLFQVQSELHWFMGLVQLLGFPPKELMQLARAKDDYFIEKDGQLTWKNLIEAAKVGALPKWEQVKNAILEAAMLRKADAFKRGETGIPDDIGERFFAIFTQIIAYKRKSPEHLLKEIAALLQPAPTPKPLLALAPAG